jgi:hypothetical protein
MAAVADINNNNYKTASTWDRVVASERSLWSAYFHDQRWSISRFAHFSKNTFFHDYVGPITPFEIVALVLVFVIPIIMAIASDKSGSGQISEYMVFIGVLVALKMNAMEFALGVSWERAILFHKAFSTVALITGAIHGIPELARLSGSEILADSRDFSGLLLLLLFGLQPILYVFIKPYFFEAFYYLHLAVYFVMVYFAIVHGASFVLFSVIAFAVDLCIRWVLGSRRVKLKVERKAGDVVQLSFEKKFTFRAGQYVFLMIPALGVHEWHPFTVSSAPHEETATLHVGVLGDWTRRLADLADGLPAINFEDDTYQIVVLISGSIGVTPHQSLANHLLDAHSRGRPLKKLIYVWALRDPKMGLVSTMVDNGQFPTNRTLEMAERNAKCIIAQDVSTNPYLTSPGVLHTELYCTRSPADAGDLPAGLAPIGAVVPLQPPSKDLEASASFDADLKYGRPDFPLLFARVKELATSMGERRVAVSVCGPASMVESATMACRAATSKEIQFDLHIEVFRL